MSLIFFVLFFLSNPDQSLDLLYFDFATVYLCITSVFVCNKNEVGLLKEQVSFLFLWILIFLHRLVCTWAPSQQYIHPVVTKWPQSHVCICGFMVFMVILKVVWKNAFKKAFKLFRHLYSESFYEYSMNAKNIFNKSMDSMYMYKLHVQDPQSFYFPEQCHGILFIQESDLDFLFYPPPANHQASVCLFAAAGLLCSYNELNE